MAPRLNIDQRKAPTEFLGELDRPSSKEAFESVRVLRILIQHVLDDPL